TWRDVELRVQPCKDLAKLRPFVRRNRSSLTQPKDRNGSRCAALGGVTCPAIPKSVASMQLIAKDWRRKRQRQGRENISRAWRLNGKVWLLTSKAHARFWRQWPKSMIVGSLPVFAL